MEIMKSKLTWKETECEQMCNVNLHYQVTQEIKLNEFNVINKTFSIVRCTISTVNYFNQMECTIQDNGSKVLGVAEYHQNPWHVILVCMF
jgi:hypothetical protein